MNILSKTLFLSASLSFLSLSSTTAYTQIDDSLDHLKCYPVRTVQPVEPFELTVSLENQFSFEQCVIEAPPIQACIETRKNFGDDERAGQVGDYLCYRIIDCVADPVGPNEALFNDQFGDWNLRLRVQRARTVCLPARKLQHGPPGAE